jgi:tetratricopeptide (TPR) repeat protein
MNFLFANLDGAAPIASPSMGPGDGEALNRRGIARFARGDAEGALEDFCQAVSAQPDDARLWNNSGLARLTLGFVSEAIADFDQALAAQPSYPEALTNRGRACQALGNWTAARADFDRAVDCASGLFLATVLHNRGALRQELGDLEGARADFDRALVIDPNHTASYVSRGTVRKLVGDLAGAMADLDRALAKVPPQSAGEIYHARAGVCVYRGDFSAAIVEYDRAIALDPQNAGYYISRGRSRYQCYDPHGVDDYLMAFRLDPAGTARELVNIAAREARDAPAVLANCKKHLRKNERDPLAFGRLGLTLALLGSDVEAVKNFARLVDLVPELELYLPLLLRELHKHCESQKAAKI